MERKPRNKNTNADPLSFSLFSSLSLSISLFVSLLDFGRPLRAFYLALYISKILFPSLSLSLLKIILYLLSEKNKQIFPLLVLFSWPRQRGIHVSLFSTWPLQIPSQARKPLLDYYASCGLRLKLAKGFIILSKKKQEG